MVAFLPLGLTAHGRHACPRWRSPAAGLAFEHRAAPRCRTLSPSASIRQLADDRKISHTIKHTRRHNPSEAHREPPNWQGSLGKLKTRAREKSKVLPGLSPRVLHEPTYSVTRPCRQFSKATTVRS